MIENRQSYSSQIDRKRPSNLSTANGLTKWYKVNFQKSKPDCRSHFAACVTSNGSLYVYGGQELSSGYTNSIWKVKIEQAVLGQAEWEEVKSKNVPQFAYSHNCGVYFREKLYFYGGTREYTGNLDKFQFTNRQKKLSEPHYINILDLKTKTWSLGSQIQPRDDFAHFFDESQGLLYVFGGFCKNVKTNEVTVFDLKTNKSEQVIDGGTSRPQSQSSQKFSFYKYDRSRPEPRTGSSMVLFDNALYIFGGQNQMAKTLGDLWKFDLETKTWQNLKPLGDLPSARSGHSLNINNGIIYLFGGSLEITKEANDTRCYNIKDNTWYVLFQDQVNKEFNPEFQRKTSPSSVGDCNSPLARKSRTSQQRFRSTQKFSSQSKSGIVLTDIREQRYVRIIQNPPYNPKPGPIPSPKPMSFYIQELKERKRSTSSTNQTPKTPTVRSRSEMRQRLRKSHVTLLKSEMSEMKMEESSPKKKEDELRHSPTSANMRRSFIFQNANQSFEKYFQEMKRRNLARGLMTSQNGSVFQAQKTSKFDNPMVQLNDDQQEVDSRRQIPNFPQGRDGHFACIYKDYLIIFGGDRHLVAFNDLYFVKL